MLVLLPRQPGYDVSRRGFTLIEMVVATFLIALLGTLLAISWKAFGIPAVQVEAQARLALSANLAAASLAQDLSGYQVKHEGDVYRLYVFADWQGSDATHLRLKFTREDQKNDANPTILVISYYVDLDTSTLVRLEEKTVGGIPVVPDVLTTVATHIASDTIDPPFLVEPQSNGDLKISFTVIYWRYKGVYSLTATAPPKDSP